jgi:hypothetical protein
MSGLGSEQTLTRDAYRSSSTPRITGTHVPPIWVAITLPEPLSALAMSQLGRPIAPTYCHCKAQVCLWVKVREQADQRNVCAACSWILRHSVERRKHP